jgi:hypothetical protein
MPVVDNGACRQIHTYGSATALKSMEGCCRASDKLVKPILLRIAGLDGHGMDEDCSPRPGADPGVVEGGKVGSATDLEPHMFDDDA